MIWPVAREPEDGLNLVKCGRPLAGGRVGNVPGAVLTTARLAAVGGTPGGRVPGPPTVFLAILSALGVAESAAAAPLRCEQPAKRTDAATRNAMGHRELIRRPPWRHGPT